MSHVLMLQTRSKCYIMLLEVIGAYCGRRSQPRPLEILEAQDGTLRCTQAGWPIRSPETIQRSKGEIDKHIEKDNQGAEMS